MNEQTTKLMFSSEFPDWETPDDLYNELNDEFHFALDVCATAENTKCEFYISPEQNALTMSWKGEGYAYMNPPYNKPILPCVQNCKRKMCEKRGFHDYETYTPGQIDFVRKASWEAALGHRSTVCLLPARTDTSIFHDLIWNNKTNSPYQDVEVRFLQRRVWFVGASAPAPFPSMIVIFNKWRNDDELSTIR